jgi:hypothetical protein
VKDSTEDTDRRDELKEAVDDAYQAVAEAVETFNDQMDEAWSDVHDAQSDYNACVAELQKWLNEHDEDVAELDVMDLEQPGAVEIVMREATADLDLADVEAAEVEEDGDED